MLKNKEVFMLPKNGNFKFGHQFNLCHFMPLLANSICNLIRFIHMPTIIIYIAPVKNHLIIFLGNSIKHSSD